MGTKLCVAGLSATTTVQQLHDLCAPYGTVKSASVVRDRKTGEWMGCGIVEMASPAEAFEVILVVSGTLMNGHTLEVFFAP